jgi:hypothetical protein
MIITDIPKKKYHRVKDLKVLLEIFINNQIYDSLLGLKKLYLIPFE